MVGHRDGSGNSSVEGVEPSFQWGGGVIMRIVCGWAGVLVAYALLSMVAGLGGSFHDL